ncbi:SDR family oxidoreductase [Lyngbya confervoides]|uniref:SDR family oxidoreductase n=1 Tax=Lyngbya confervoides BDU141951 TaxID=1574623 RepID=A0ABD4T0G9_9CYAN|nr:SDR family oxidoreductase [Lyngbya confervoides]MCM1982202.1 SDR family oxidoreductase [Lyngbya confervoides BDU141951]
MKAFVAGATGETGRRIVTELRDQQIEVCALVRDRAKALSILPPSVDLVEGGLESVGALAEAMAGCDVLLCATGARPSLNPLEPMTVDYLGTKNLVEAARDQGIAHFVLVSSLCVSKLFHPLNLFWLILFWKRQAEKYLQDSGLTYTIVRPGGLKSTDSQPPLVMAPADTLFEGSIPRLQVAKVCVAALGNAHARNQIVEIVASESNPEVSIADLYGRIAQAGGSVVP